MRDQSLLAALRHTSLEAPVVEAHAVSRTLVSSKRFTRPRGSASSRPRHLQSIAEPVRARIVAAAAAEPVPRAVALQGTAGAVFSAPPATPRRQPRFRIVWSY